MMYIDKYSTLSKMLSLNPFIKLTFFIVFISTALISRSLLFLVILSVFIAAINLSNSVIKPLRYLKLSAIPLGFIVMGIAPILFQKTTAENYIFGGNYLVGYGITKQSLTESSKIVFRGYASTSGLFFLVLHTPISQLMWMFRKLRFPNLLIDLMGLIYRNIFSMLQLSRQLFIAQQCRLGYSRSRKRDLGILISQTFILSLKKSNDQYNGLEARCYSTNFRMLNQEFDISKPAIFKLIVTTILIILTFTISFSQQWL